MSLGRVTVGAIIVAVGFVYVYSVGIGLFLLNQKLEQYKLERVR